MKNDRNFFPRRRMRLLSPFQNVELFNEESGEMEYFGYEDSNAREADVEEWGAQNWLEDRLEEPEFLEAEFEPFEEEMHKKVLLEEEILLVVDGTERSLQNVASTFAEKILKVKRSKIKKIKKTVKNFKGLATLLSKYKKIGRLVLIFHGVPGGLLIGSSVKSLDSLDRLFSGNRPTIKRIDFEACSVGKGIKEMVHFGSLFGSPTMCAWNYFWSFAPIIIKIPSRTPLALAQNQINKYKGYFMGGEPDARRLVTKRGRYKFFLEWFRWDYNPDETLPPFEEGLDNRRRAFFFRKRSEAKYIHIHLSEIEEYDKRYADFRRNRDIPLERVVIHLDLL